MDDQLMLGRLGIAAVGCIGLLVAGCSSESSGDSIGSVGAQATEVGSASDSAPPELYLADYKQGEEALGRYVLRFDPELDCVYFGSTSDGSELRFLPQWPPGYQLRVDPIRVVGPGGSTVFLPGERLIMSGGGRRLDSVPPSVNRCGVEGVDSVFVIGEITHDDE